MINSKCSIHLTSIYKYISTEKGFLRFYFKPFLIFQSKRIKYKRSKHNKIQNQSLKVVRFCQIRNQHKILNKIVKINFFQSFIGLFDRFFLGATLCDYFNNYGLIYTIYSFKMCRIKFSTNLYLLYEKIIIHLIFN